ncbi:MAG TPA: hypothetical protein VKI65_13675 [Gemmataceae bacterium]|nr:hypothetical protein [Gemmataceae bacterium]
MGRTRFMLVLLAGLVPALSLTLAQTPGRFNEREIRRPLIPEEAKQGIWVLDFRFKDPRLITVDIPGRGKRVVWYLWYQVINNTGEPRTFIPDFELVTLDKNTVHHDQVLPKAQMMIWAVEDAVGHANAKQRGLTDPSTYLKNSVTIASQPIPVSKADAVPKAVTGVAMWDDVNRDSNRYSIFVSGLSNGWSVDDKKVVRRKTLQLNFRRFGDEFSKDIRWEPPAEWIYRASSLKVGAEEKKVGALRGPSSVRAPALQPAVPVKNTAPRN